MKSSLYLLNDDIHSFDDVVSMCRKYLSYPLSQGMSIANIVHTTGKSRIYKGDSLVVSELYEIFKESGFKVKIQEEDE